MLFYVITNREKCTLISNIDNLNSLLDNCANSDWLFCYPYEINSALKNKLIYCLEHQWYDNKNIDLLWLTVQNYDFPHLTAQQLSKDDVSWVGKVSLIKKILETDRSILENNYRLLNYLIEHKTLFQADLIQSKLNKNNIVYHKNILAIVPHYECNEWLDYCLFSLINQSVKLTDIVVVDDQSSKMPKNISANYPQVTLLKSKHKIGPYQIIQSVINDSDYDYYMFQDADDWSMIDRLRVSIELMDKMGADMVGTQEYRVDDINHTLTPVVYPLNVNKALQEKPGHPLLHPTSLIKRSAFLRVNGFANALLYGADTEFLLRSHFHLKIYNSPEFGYFRRKRHNSLTTSPTTGLGTPEREKLLNTLKAIAYNNYQIVKQGKIPSTTPLVSKPCVKFEKVP
ncbi:glycosyltransferase family 2 protein [Cyanobacterium stanieri LEGE 03274]|uniref:Glycosyltransferase family 2 protein n=1 Tax=Cyanobacterium stanieri LEGE 03274 TaxID=1828756 RepID=A0ABR9V6H0_9CHRO|nr:glycosyltransferase family A protein [Cyanobacterium stanieri]MBE9223496.1 glycosyltransferase family 2 protein [Cyanobacterium stanieri LEGE 03274]